MDKSSTRKHVFHHTLIFTALAIGLGLNMAHAADTPAPQAHSDGLGAAISDTVITAQVKAKLLDEDSLVRSDIVVTTTNGVVTLNGSAPSQDAVKIAMADASSVSGVKSVDNNLSTPGSSKTLAKTRRIVSDSWITAKVKSALFADNVSNGMDVSVETMYGVVMLKGALPDQRAIDRVKEVAEQVGSVKSVDTSKLVVASS